MYQLSIDYGRDMQHHDDLASRLASLREKGVLVIGSPRLIRRHSVHVA